jgi:HK97 gp10 family phage protein
MADGVTVNTRQLIENINKLRKIAPTLDAELEKALERSAVELSDRARSLAPKDTGKYARLLQAKPVDGTAEFTRKGGAKKSVEAVAAWGLYAQWIWHFLEFGTVKMSARPHIYPAYRLLRKRMNRRITRAMGRAIKAALK